MIIMPSFHSCTLIICSNDLLRQFFVVLTCDLIITMIVKRIANDDASQNQKNISDSDLDKAMEFSSPKLIKNSAENKFSAGETDRILYEKMKVVYGGLEKDQVSVESSEETGSPKSVTEYGKWNVKSIDAFVHSQVLRIREEDLHLGEDFGEGLSVFNAKDRTVSYQLPDHVDYFLFSRPILPASPLGDKTAIKTMH